MSNVRFSRSAMRAVAAIGAVGLAACSTETTAPAAGSLPDFGSPAKVISVGNGAFSSSTVQLCKWATTTAPVTFSVSKNGGTAQQVVITPTNNLSGFMPYTKEACTYLLQGGTGTDSFSITELGGPTLDVITGSGDAQAFAQNVGTRTATVTVNNTNYAQIIFKNSVTPTSTGGCTYTQGYWKTHNASGSASKKADPTWNMLANKENTKFFNDKLNAAGNGFFNSTEMDTWIDVFDSPVKGDARISLAHQFMAAYLNKLDGASLSGTGVQAAYDGARLYFLGGSATAAQISAWATTLDQYNNGILGPGHCGDELINIS